MIKQIALACLLPAAFAATAAESAGNNAAVQTRMAGDTARAREVWNVFDRWLSAYANADLDAVMTLFDPEVRFSFQGSKDQSYADLKTSYAREFERRDATKRWVPTVEEVYASGDIVLVRAVWELQIAVADGTSQTRARNRSMDVFRRAKDGSWRIFRSINYPEKG